MKTRFVDTELQAVFVGSLERKITTQKAVLVLCQYRDGLKRLLKPGHRDPEFSKMIEGLEIAISILKDLAG